MGFFAEDAVYDEFHGARHEGREAIRAAFEPQFRGGVRSGPVSTRKTSSRTPKRARVLISWTCTMTTRKGPGGWRGLDLLHFADGRLVEKQTYAKAKVPLLNPVET